LDLPEFRKFAPISKNVLTFCRLAALACWRKSILTDGTRTIVVQEIAAHQGRLRALVRCLFVRPSDVDDVLQEINAVLWEKGSEFRPGTDFWAWASQIARFKALNRTRKYIRDQLVFDQALLEQLAEVAEKRLRDFDQRREALDHCLKKLPAPQRQLIELRYAAGQTVEAIAVSIGRPAGSIRQTLYRVRESLRACIQAQLEIGD
jgi:RNA polymerase sigma-70 factor (ECF subfamily)